MKKSALLTLSFLAVPLVASAQTFQNFLVNVVVFLNNIVIPFLMGIAFLIFVINAIRYFVIGGNNEEGREKAKALALYSVAAFVFIIIFWGITNMLTTSLGLGGCTQPYSDYYLQKVSGPPPAPCT